VLNVGGYYNPLLAFFDHMVSRGFLSEDHRAMVLVEAQPKTLLERFARYRPPTVPKRIERAET
jgi:predicted Rossmann-fold nucleotide-binding protein